MSVNEYVTKFTQLSRYAPHEVDTDEKKQECFFNDLNNELAYALEVRDFENFQGMVNKVLVLENRRGVALVLLDRPIAPIDGRKLEFGGYLGFSEFLTCGRKFALYAALYIGGFR
jgi:hypothetical protein